MTFEIESFIPDPQENYEDELWVGSECYRFYVRQRRFHCNYKELLDLWLLAPYCTECASSDPLKRHTVPDIVPSGWEMDILCHIGPDTFKRIQNALKEDSEFSLTCKGCMKELRPWQEDDVYVVCYHLEEHYGITLETPGRKQPSKKLRNQIIKLYNEECFGCQRKDVSLHIDHIIPQSKDGDSAFRNLQPLCAKCGNAKGDQLPDTVEFFSSLYFGSYPVDSYEGLFW